jgi:DNA-directed RNA polymerase sigma subunit (sigma70/sigma32)
VSTAHDWLRRDGMTVRQIAAELRISPNRVKQLEHRAIQKIRENPWLLRRLFPFVDFDCDLLPQPQERAHR